MSDFTLRQLELQWRESGSVEDGAAFYRERMRVGRVDQDGLKLAATLGDQVAAHILGTSEPPVEPFQDIMGAKTLPWSDAEFAIRASLAPGELLVERWEQNWQDSKRARRALEESLDLCASRDQAAARKRQEGILAWRERVEGQRDAMEPKFLELTLALLGILEAACRYVLGEEVNAWQALSRAFWVLGKDEVGASIRRELGPWALGLRDPLTRS